MLRVKLKLLKMKRLEIDCLLMSVIVMMRIMLVERPSHPIIYKFNLHQIVQLY